MQRKEQIINHRKLIYSVSGSGPVVVLLHGFGEDGTVWNEQVPYLENDFTLIVPDLPGSGGSPIRNDMSMEGLAESVRALLQQENVKECVLIGHSMGGYVTLAFAKRWPHLLQGFGLFHSTAYADTEEKKKIREKGIEFIQQHGAALFLETSTPNLFSEKTKKEKPSILQKHLTGIHNFSDAALVSYYRSMISRPDRTTVLQQAKFPVLFILGRHDNAVPLLDGLAQSHLPEKAYIHILEASGHMGMLEEPELSADLLKHYLITTLKDYRPAV